jgi:hypothetical protein
MYPRCEDDPPPPKLTPLSLFPAFPFSSFVLFAFFSSIAVRWTSFESFFLKPVAAGSCRDLLGA